MKKIKRFVDWACDQLEIENLPKIEYSDNKQLVDDRRTFGTTTPDGKIWVFLGNRNTADILRTLCHEIIHHRQFEVGTATTSMNEEERLFIEDEANALAGRMLRAYGKEHLDIYEGKSGPEFQSTLEKTYVIPELPNQDAYLQYRFNVAMASVRGAEQRKKEGAPAFEKESVWGENMIVVSTEPDAGEHIDAALKLMGMKGKKLITTSKSEEPKLVQNKSPVKAFKGYPR